MVIKREPGVRNLTCEILRETEQELLELGFPKAAIELGKAEFVIINSLGGEFWSRECTSFGISQKFFSEKKDARVLQLANKIWVTKNLVGFEDLLSRSRNGDFESAFYEIFAASWFLERSIRVEYNTPSGSKGLDFDLKIEGGLGFDELNVEVKARKQEFVREKQLTSFVSNARSQVPAGKPAALFVSLKMSSISLNQQKMDSILARCIQRSKTWEFVIYVWDASIEDEVIALCHAAVDGNGRCDGALAALSN